MSAPLVVTDRDGRKTLVLSRPDRGNSLSEELVERLHEALDDAERDGTRFLVIEGAGRNFCTGFDLEGLEEASDGDLLARFVRIEQLLARVWSAPFMTLAIAKGRTFGAGADLFAACSGRMAFPDATFSFPGAAFGLVLGTRRLAARVGVDAALSVVTSGRVLAAAEAQRCGLVTEVAEAEQLDETLARAAQEATRLDAETVKALRLAIGDQAATLDGDLAALVRSAAQPGLKQRIINYRAKAQKK